MYPARELYDEHCQMAPSTTIVVHSRDNEEVGVAHEVKLPKIQPQFSQMIMGQYWLGQNKLSGGPEMLSKCCTEI